MINVILPFLRFTGILMLIASGIMLGAIVWAFVEEKVKRFFSTVIAFFKSTNV